MGNESNKREFDRSANGKVTKWIVIDASKYKRDQSEQMELRSDQANDQKIATGPSGEARAKGNETGTIERDKNRECMLRKSIN